LKGIAVSIIGASLVFVENETDTNKLPEAEE
jgi:hypothetical protein